MMAAVHSLRVDSGMTFTGSQSQQFCMADMQYDENQSVDFTD